MFLSLLMLISGVTIQPHSQIEITTTTVKGTASGGSGVIIAKNRILTAYHVVKDIKDAKATCGEKTIPTKAIAASPQLDLAVIEFTEDCDIIPIQIADTDAPLAAELYTAGYPSKVGFMVTRGIVSSYKRDVTTKIPQMWSDVASWYGNSGGPAINSEGKLIGILLSIQTLSTGTITDDDVDIDYEKYTCLSPVTSIKKFLAKVDEKAK